MCGFVKITHSNATNVTLERERLELDKENENTHHCSSGKVDTNRYGALGR